MRSVTIGFSKAKSPLAILSKLICWVQGTNFSHVYVRLDSVSLGNRGLIYQASGTKVNFENVEHFEGHAKTMSAYKVEVSEEVFERVVGFCIDNLDKPYSKLEFLGMAWVILKAKVGYKVENPYKNRLDGFVCSEIGAYVAEEAGIEIKGDKDSLYPEAVRLLLKAASESLDSIINVWEVV